MRFRFGGDCQIAVQGKLSGKLYLALALSATIHFAGLPFPVTAQTVDAPFGLLRGSSDGADTGELPEAPVFGDAEPITIPAENPAEPQQPVLADDNPLQGRARRSEPQTPVLDDINTAAPSARSNVRAGQVEAGNTRAEMVNPFVAEGFRIGTWQAYASVEQSVGFSTNIDQSVASGEGDFSETDFNFSAQSDWSRHQAQINASAKLKRNFGADEELEPAGNVDGSLRLEMRDGVSATISAGYGFTTEAVTSNAIGADVNQRPGVHAFNGALAIARSNHRLFSNVRSSFVRRVHEDASLSTGGVLSQTDRDNTLYLLTGRAGYETSPAFKPFIEGSIGARVFDAEFDRNGEQRDSLIYAAGAGVEFDLGEKLSGEISLGYRIEDFKDDTLQNLQGMIVDGSFEWSPWRETLVRLTTQTEFTGSTIAGQNGAIDNRVELAVSRQANDRLLLESSAAIDIERQSGNSVDKFGWNVGTGFQYSLSRYLSLTGKLGYEQVNSDNISQSYEATTARVGVKIQR